MFGELGLWLFVIGGLMLAAGLSSLLPWAVQSHRWAGWRDGSPLWGLADGD